jgi:MerR family transcriptional regulator, light-induced transcriptional regulator
MNLYNINSVSKITGLSAFVIRAWEKRYSVVTPERTNTNRRLYSEEDIERLKLLKEAVDRGNNIGNIAGLSTEALREMLLAFKPVEPGIKKQLLRPERSDSYLEKCIQSIHDLDYRGLERQLIRASIDLSHPVLIDSVLIPLLKEIGNSWQDGTLRIVQEHVASAVIRTFLYNLRDSFKPSDYGSKILITTPMGQQHEFGALIASLIAFSEGWDAVYLGPDLPSAEIIAASVMLKPKVVALSIVFASEDELLNKEIEMLKYLPEEVKLVVGGSGSGYYNNTIAKINGFVLNDFNSFRNFLRTMGRTNGI